MAFGATYDACVLYPASLRDFLVRLGGRRVFHARWTDQILDEMTRAVLPNRADLTAEQLQRTRTLMCEAVPGCLTTGYQGLIEGLELPDPNDRHVLAAAIRAARSAISSGSIARNPARSTSRAANCCSSRGAPGGKAATCQWTCRLACWLPRDRM